MWLPHRCMRHTWENGKCVISKWKTGITALNYTGKTDRKSCRTPLNRGAPDMISCLFYVMVYLSVSSYHNGPDIRFSEGERNSKEGAFIRSALNGYRTARQFQNPFRNRKSQAISASWFPHPSRFPYRKSLPPQNQEKASSKRRCCLLQA